MSIQTTSNQPRLVWAYFKPSSPDFRVLQFEFIPTGEMAAHFTSSNEVVVSGRATFFTESDAVISSAIFRNDALVSTAAGNNLADTSFPVYSFGRGSPAVSSAIYTNNAHSNIYTPTGQSQLLQGASFSYHCF